jgi:hypothetical protein
MGMFPANLSYLILNISTLEHCISTVCNYHKELCLLIIKSNLYALEGYSDRLCVLVVRIPGYGSRGPGSILRATIFSEK